MSIETVRGSLKAACAKAGSIRKWAAANGFSHAYVSEVLSGGRGPSDNLLKCLGFVREKRETFKRVDGARP